MDCSESKCIFNQVRQDARSLREPDTYSIRRSPTSSTLDANRRSFSERFEFDQEVFGTKVYQNHFVSLTKQSSREASGKETESIAPEQHTRESGEHQRASRSDAEIQALPSQSVELRSGASPAIESVQRVDSGVSQCWGQDTETSTLVGEDPASYQLPGLVSMMWHDSTPIKTEPQVEPRAIPETRAKTWPSDSKAGYEVCQDAMKSRGLAHSNPYSLPRQQSQLVSPIEDVIHPQEPHSPDQSSSRELFKAMENGRLDEVKLLLDAGAYTNATDAQELDPLMHAVTTGSPSIVRSLLDYGASPAVTDRKGSSPLHLACAYGHVEIVRALLDAGADFDSVNRSHRTPLHHAAMSGRPEIVTLLLQYGARAGARDRDRRSPLWFACYEGRLEATRALVCAGADVNAADCYGQTPFHAAAADGHEHVTQFLGRRGLLL